MLGKISVIYSPSTTNLSWTALGLNLGLCSENPASKTLNYGKVIMGSSFKKTVISATTYCIINNSEFSRFI